jgi:hypothetical protein
MMVVMALVTTAMTMPLLDLVVPRAMAAGRAWLPAPTGELHAGG